MPEAPQFCFTPSNAVSSSRRRSIHTRHVGTHARADVAASLTCSRSSWPPLTIQSKALLFSINERATTTQRYRGRTRQGARNLGHWSRSETDEQGRVKKHTSRSRQEDVGSKTAPRSASVWSSPAWDSQGRVDSIGAKQMGPLHGIGTQHCLCYWASAISLVDR